jgi:hypothetical protein
MSVIIKKTPIAKNKNISSMISISCQNGFDQHKTLISFLSHFLVTLFSHCFRLQRYLKTTIKFEFLFCSTQKLLNLCNTCLSLKNKYVCEKSLIPHELCYLGLFNFPHSIFFHVIIILKNSPKKCWSFIPFFGTQIVNEPFIRKYLLNIHCHASNVDKC